MFDSVRTPNPVFLLIKTFRTIVFQTSDVGCLNSLITYCIIDYMRSFLFLPSIYHRISAQMPFSVLFFVINRIRFNLYTIYFVNKSKS